jgi:hypothetical protein
MQWEYTLNIDAIRRYTRYVAIKALKGHATDLIKKGILRELWAILKTSSPDQSDHCIQVYSRFVEGGKGEEGEHLCLVMDVLGGNVKSLINKDEDRAKNQSHLHWQRESSFTLCVAWHIFMDVESYTPTLSWTISCLIAGRLQRKTSSSGQLTIGPDTILLSTVPILLFDQLSASRFLFLHSRMQ